MTLLALAWAAARTFDVLQGPVRFTVLTLLVLVVGVSLHHVIMALAITHRRTEIMIKIAMAMMILGWAALMTGQFANVAFFDQARVNVAPPSWFQAWPTIEFSLLTALQVVVVLGRSRWRSDLARPGRLQGSTLLDPVRPTRLPVVFSAIRRPWWRCCSDRTNSQSQPVVRK